MKKTILIVGLVMAALIAVGVGVAFAQGPAPYTGGGFMQQNGTGYLHTYMVTAFAEKLGLKVEDVNARLTAGETMYDIAIADGVKAEEFPALMVEVRSQALTAAVKAGVITQTQADWMKSRGFGNGNGRGMMRGGFGWQNQQTNP
jgi:hypothetical protein